jgi:hypothetical protein
MFRCHLTSIGLSIKNFIESKKIKYNMVHVRPLFHIKAKKHQLKAQYVLLYSLLILIPPTCFNPPGSSSGITVLYI